MLLEQKPIDAPQIDTNTEFTTEFKAPELAINKYKDAVRKVNEEWKWGVNRIRSIKNLKDPQIKDYIEGCKKILGNKLENVDPQTVKTLKERYHRSVYTKNVFAPLDFRLRDLEATNEMIDFCASMNNEISNVSVEDSVTLMSLMPNRAFTMFLGDERKDVWKRGQRAETRDTIKNYKKNVMIVVNRYKNCQDSNLKTKFEDLINEYVEGINTNPDNLSRLHKLVADSEKLLDGK